MTLITSLTRGLGQSEIMRIWGRVLSIDQTTLRIGGLNALACVGDGVEIEVAGGDKPSIFGEIVSFTEANCIIYAFDRLTGVRIGDRAKLVSFAHTHPNNSWLGNMIDARGNLADGLPAEKGPIPLKVDAAAPPAALRRGFGTRMASGMNAFDTFLPLCRGQRIGLFAAPGVGKSSLIASLANRAEADVVVVALIGERGREVRAFFHHELSDDVRERTVLFAATSDQAAPLKRRAAMTAMCAAEHFRDQGKHVLLLFDSLTRYADAHREIALAGGEPASLRAYPPSTFQMLSSLVERAGPGIEDDGPAGSGDITAVFTVLAAGGDMDEPIPDAVRGFLDGHVILDRAIAERGRFPAIDILRSASRALPGAASQEENDILRDARTLLGAYRDGEIMVKAGLYEAGSDPTLDLAVNRFAALDEFISQESDTPENAFAALRNIIATGNPAADETAQTAPTE